MCNSGCPRNPKHWGKEYINRKGMYGGVGSRAMVQTNVHVEKRHVKNHPKKRKI